MVCHLESYKLKNCQGKSNLNLKFGQIQVSNGRYVANVVIVVVIIVVVVVVDDVLVDPKKPTIEVWSESGFPVVIAVGGW